MKWTSPVWVLAYSLWKLRWWAHGPLQILISWFKRPARRERSSSCSLLLQPSNELHTDKKCHGCCVFFLAYGCDLNKSVVRAGVGWRTWKLSWRSSLVKLGYSAIIPWQLHKYCTPEHWWIMHLSIKKRRKGRKKIPELLIELLNHAGL